MATQIKDRIKGIKKLPLSSLKQFRYGNPKNFSDSQKNALDTSLQRIGYAQAVVVREYGGNTKDIYELLDGHHRWRSLQELVGDDGKITCLIVDMPDNNMAREFVLASSTIKADFERNALATFVNSLIADAEEDAAWLAAGTGFSQSELDELLGNLNVPIPEDLDLDSGDSLTHNEPIAQSGTLSTSSTGPEANQEAGSPAEAIDDNLDDNKLPEKIIFTAALKPEQHEAIQLAIRKVRLAHKGETTIPDALEVIARHFLKEEGLK